MSEVIKFAVISQNSDDSTDFQIMQVRVDDVERKALALYPYGLFANAPKDALVVALTVGGQQEKKVGIATTPQDRFKDLEPGEVVLGNILSKSFIKIKANGDIKVSSARDVDVDTVGDVDVNAGGSVDVVAGTGVNITGGTGITEIAVTGNISLTSVAGDINVTATVGDVNVTASAGTATITAPAVDLGGPGGLPVAQIGASVVVIPSGSSAGTFPVTIGSAIVKAL